MIPSPRKTVLFSLFALLAPLSAAWAQHLDCDPCNDHYGRVEIGTSIRRYLVLKNTGSRALRIKSKSVTGAAFTLGDFAVPVTVAAGSSIKLPVIFSPVALGKNYGNVTINSSAQNRQLRIDVHGVGVNATSPHLSVSPASLDFGTVTVGSSAKLPLTLSATNAPVTISGARSDSSEFALSGLTVPLTIASGRSVQINVKFAPTAGGAATGKLTFLSNADNSPTLESLAGQGQAAGSHRTDLSWNASGDPVIGYNVYRGGKHGGPYSQINSALDSSASYSDSSVSAGATYYYVVTSVSADDLESTYSNEVKVLIPSP